MGQVSIIFGADLASSYSRKLMPELYYLKEIFEANLMCNIRNKALKKAPYLFFGASKVKI